MSQNPKSRLREADVLARFLDSGPPVMVLTGAGVSTASGIPDYRDETGQWKRRQPVQHQEFLGDPSIRQRYWARSLAGWPVMQQAKPNSAHHDLFRLEQAGLITQLVTQNVDRLHQKSGSHQTIDLHGRADRVVCMACGHGQSRDDLHERCLALNPRHEHVRAAVAPDGDADLEGDFSGFTVPDCLQCGGIMKPDVVFFGDNVPLERVDRVFEALDRSRGLLVIGSSLMVFSGFRFARRASESRKPLVLLTRGATRADTLASLKLDAGIPEVLSSTLQLLMDRVPSHICPEES